MTFGNNGAGPLGVPPCGPPGNPLAGQMVGQAGANYPPLYRPDFESLLSAVSRGAVSLNEVMAVGTAFAGNAAAGGSFAGPQGNPTLLQAMSQGVQQNGTNGINGVAAGGGTINSSNASIAAPQNQPVTTLNLTMGGSHIVSPNEQMGAGSIGGAAGASTTNAQLVSPIQYGGN